MNDLREAKQQVDSGGFGWGFRQMFSSRNLDHPPGKEPASSPQSEAPDNESNAKQEDG